MLRCWLVGTGIRPDADVEIVVISPPRRDRPFRRPRHGRGKRRYPGAIRISRCAERCDGARDHRPHPSCVARRSTIPISCSSTAKPPISRGAARRRRRPPRRHAFPRRTDCRRPGFRSSYVPASRRRVPLRRPRTSRCPCAASRATSVSSPRTAAAAPLSTSTGVRWHAADQRSLSTWVATRRGRSCATSPPPECREECPSSSRATSVGPRRSGYRPASTCLTLQRAPLRLTPRH